MTEPAVIVPPECFDPKGNVACFRCWPGDMDGEFLVIPATRDAEQIFAAYAEHAQFAGHESRPALCVRGTDGQVHVWLWPE